MDIRLRLNDPKKRSL